MADVESLNDQGNELDQFVHHISHDLRASVRALRDLPTWIESDLAEAQIELPSDASEYLQMMQKHALRLDRMLLDLLTYSRVGRRQEVRVVDLSETLDEALNQLSIPENCRINCAFNVPSPQIFRAIASPMPLPSCSSRGRSVDIISKTFSRKFFSMPGPLSETFNTTQSLYRLLLM